MTPDPYNTSLALMSREILALLHGTHPNSASLSRFRELRLQSHPPQSRARCVLNLQPLLKNGKASPKQIERIGNWLLNELASGSTVTICGYGTAEHEPRHSSPASSEQAESP